MLNVFEEVGAALKQMKQLRYIEGLVEVGTMHNHLRDVRGGYYGGLHCDDDKHAYYEFYEPF